MAKDFKVKVFDGTKRAETFTKVFERTEVCVLSPLPVLAALPCFDEPQIVFMLDLHEITHEERQRLVNHISNEFNLNPMLVDNQIAQNGVPILASECTLTIENPQVWIDLDDEMNLTELDVVFSDWDDDDYEDDDDEWDVWG